MEKESYRILVVDDDLRLRDLLKRYLGEQGFNVKTVSDADCGCRPCPDDAPARP